MMKKFNSGTPVFGKDSSVIPVDLRGHKIYVKVKINDSQKDYNFILDTGALTAIDEKVAAELNLKKGVELPSPGGSKKIYLAEDKLILSLGDKKVKEFIAIIFDLPEADPHIDGFIGSDFLRFFRLTIDYRQKKIVLSESKYPLDLTTAYKVKISKPFPFRFPQVGCVIDDTIRTKGILDTGSPFAIVCPLSLIEKQDFSGERTLIKSKGTIAKWPFTTTEYNYLARLKSFRMGTFEIKNVPVIYAELPRNFPGLLLGKDFLSHFLTTIDYPKDESTLLLYNNEKFKTNLFSTGLELKKDKDGKIIIEGFWEGSPAERSGIQVGDEVLKINSKIVNDTTDLREIKNILNDDSIEKIELLVKSGEDVKRLIIRKEMLLPEIKH